MFIMSHVHFQSMPVTPSSVPVTEYGILLCMSIVFVYGLLKLYS